MIYHIDPALVKCDIVPHRRDVEKQMELLRRQGMIEPLVAYYDSLGTWHVDTSDYPYAPAQVTAAFVLGWPTVILTDNNHSD